MTEPRFCFACYCNKDKNVKMIYRSGKKSFGTYKCPECLHKVEKKYPLTRAGKYI